MKRTQTVTDHRPGARAARQQRGVWVPGPVYPALASAEAAARRVPAAGQTAYRPPGTFQAYAAPCENGGALWVRYVGGPGPVPPPLPPRMTVRVPDYGPGPGYEGLRIVTVSVRPHCPVCGGPRGWDRIKPDPFMRDDVTHVRDKWTNPCGHVDRYDQVLAEARRTPAVPGGYTPEEAPALKLPALQVPCPKCRVSEGELCTGYGGRRLQLLNVHQARVAAWNVARIQAVPSAALILDATSRRRITHARQAADLVADHGYEDEAQAIRTQMRIQGGQMSAKQALLLLLDRAEAAWGGEA